MDSWADEGPALLLLLLSAFGESALALGGRGGRLNSADSLGDSYLDAPNDFRAQFARTMQNCAMLQWGRRSEESAAQMRKDCGSLASKFAGAGRHRSSIEAPATYCAGRVYRKRSCCMRAWSSARS